MGTSAIVSAVGLSLAILGSLTSGGASFYNKVQNYRDRKRVYEIMKNYQEKKGKFKLIKEKIDVHNRVSPDLSKTLYEGIAKAGKDILRNVNEMIRIANVAGLLQATSIASGVHTGVFAFMDIYFVFKNYQKLRKRTTSRYAVTIREVAQQLQGALDDLKSKQEELRRTTPEAVAEDTSSL